MSWFQTTNFASLAKTALKEAQKTIDRALELKDEEESSTESEEEKPGNETEGKSDENETVDVGGTEDKHSSEEDVADSNLIDLDQHEPDIQENASVEDSNSVTLTATSQEVGLSNLHLTEVPQEEVSSKDEKQDDEQAVINAATDDVHAAFTQLSVHHDVEEVVPEEGENSISVAAEPVPASIDREVEIQEANLIENFTSQSREEAKDTTDESSQNNVGLEEVEMPNKPALAESAQSISVNTKEVREFATQTDSEPVPTASVVVKAKAESGAKVAALEEKIAAKDKDIEQLRNEGEKLSKKQLELSVIIKKLRAREKEKDSTIVSLKADYASKCTELERLMTAFVSKEGVEQSQVDTISKLSKENKNLEKENERLKSELEDAVENCNTMKVSVENTSLELLETQNMIAAVQREGLEVDRLTKEKSEALTHNDALRKEVDHLRQLVNETQKQFSQKEMDLKAQVTAATTKCHLLESEISNLATEAADATMPLSMEIEKLQSEVLNTKTAADKREKLLHSRIHELETRVSSAEASEAAAVASKKFSEQSSESLEIKVERLESSLKNTLVDLQTKNETIERLQTTAQCDAQAKAEEIKKLKRSIDSLQGDLKSEVAEKKKLQAVVDQLRDNQTVISNVSNNNGAPANFFQSMQSTQGSSSAAPSKVPGHGSGENSPSSQSVLSEVSYADDLFDPYNQNPPPMTPKSFFETFSSFSNVENLYAQLRQKDGELYQLQEETSKNEKIRKTLNEEIAQLTIQNQELQVNLTKMSDLEARLADVEKNYNAVLQMYGEKVEEAEELRMDLEDVKQMYKAQIDQLLQR